ncbi:MAG: tRNA pseudouridine(38-40) synthase TruA [Nitrospirae bacterium CG_4_9_14_3_um_filter_53_35]|nr:MAG: tRNA pseudouridine(38-40) synthase TruA [Nitrospirae bacterium CG08_land_8_20_14_0_20_52_24]PIW85443.1 MAG: tRNA pseudouridine(38-40) synthase TruA [Nitrospirae bacterium CG_4_8_14_3_um_filter_50_41]PIX84648.1 MAG: tRNA pseudouridine(38-40) synthase TruA [Nitrospirae bacterium CG_4_10_14_3_um_filter_53_41]PJA76742.1 MAG: tRNA pseudouridine(38-40) synthase TruA [Nitrospirae bacterium CG_4_9_14_3_um_filter_53_35]
MTHKSAPGRFRLTLEYDGTRYSGWQKQHEVKTLQGSLLQAAETLFGSDELDIQGSGRTDAGVHALNYTAHLEVRTDLSPEAILRGMNDALPRDMALLRVEKAHPRFHARHNCIARSYIYRLSKRKSAFDRKYVWWVRDPLDLEAMRRAAGLLVGMHDFVSFAEKQELKKSTMALVHLTELTENDGLILFRIIGSHFLWKMVRRIVGLLVEVGRHGLAVEDVGSLLTEKSDRPVRYIAPAAGLFFERAFYHEQELQEFLHLRDEA